MIRAMTVTGQPLQALQVRQSRALRLLSCRSGHMAAIHAGGGFTADNLRASDRT
jgi:hypothetical protein